MKKILTLILFTLPFVASAQHSYISSSGLVYLVSGSTERFGSPDIYVDAQYNTIRGVWVATLSLLATGTTTNIVKTHQYEFDNATIDAISTTETITVTCAPDTATFVASDVIQNILLQAVEARLITETGSDIFTLH